MHVDIYKNFDQLARDQRGGIDYCIQRECRDSQVLVIAPHGGGIEPGTSEVARALAGEDYSWYCFEGIKNEGNQRLHISSIAFDEKICEAMLKEARLAVVVHGCEGEQPIVYVGGLQQHLIKATVSALVDAGFTAILDTTYHSGQYPKSLCNRSASGKGIQLELSLGLRSMFFASLDRWGRKTTTPSFDLFTGIVQEKIEQGFYE